MNPMIDLTEFKKQLEQFNNGELNSIIIKPEVLKAMRDEYYGMRDRKSVV